MIRGNLYHHHEIKYYLLAYCIMPNHVHVLLQPIEPIEQAEHDEIGEREDRRSPLSGIMHSLKSYTAHEANRILGREGAFWHRESYDHWIRDEAELERIVNYIQINPVEAGLSKTCEEYLWCSCHDRLLQDGQVTGWLGWS